MTLEALAAPSDLPSTWQSSPRAAKALGVVSSAVREAAGNPILAATVTAIVTGSAARLLRVPSPVSAVTAVKVDGSTITDYKVIPEGLWRAGGWGWEPTVVEVSATFGLAAVPADIIDICVQLAVAWLEHDAEGGGSTAGLTSVRIDDAAEAYSDEAAGQISPVFIPASTRQWLAARFGGNAVIVETTL